MVPDQVAAWEAVRIEEFDPTTTVVLEEGQSLDTSPTSTLSILRYDSHTITIAVDTDQPGYLVLPDAHYPGWQAAVDGQPEPIRRANYAFRAVYVPKGQRTVQFSFEPVIWKVGLLVSGVTLLVLGVWIIWRLVGTRK